jgi:hypothetical protein
VNAGILKSVKTKPQHICFSYRNKPPDSLLTFNGRNIPSVNSVKYLGLITDKKITWKLYIQTIKTKAFRTFIRLYSPFRSEQLSANIKLTLYKALIRSKMSYACPAWEFAAEIHLLQLQDKVYAALSSFPRRLCEMCMWLFVFRTFTTT